ncbi:GntR family transcriptional regulator [Anaeroglobus geminatus]|uniref:Transcriptional regulator, GntR family n=1 Tax=Anaeroglobus geminatus F0357 TaxID=861450 RepID=G9YFS4_9FIRM|nr:GntR family transcriptional regulator [Anaeroglobus geminatus]EHM42892.1 transcriptional regulator, GntR family [Anaeroglobus geminatus F0357]
MKEKKESLSDRAYAYILERIITFELAPNAPVVEDAICTELHISRTPVREALRRLEAEGFVTKIRNLGSFIRPYTQEDIRESCEIRKIFELYALKSCVKQVKPEEINAVRALLLELTEQSPVEAYYASDTALHNMITKYCINAKIHEILKSLDVQLEAIRKISAQTPKRLLSSCEEHLAILDMIEEMDLQKASIFLERHLENVEQSSLRAYQRLRVEKLGT